MSKATMCDGPECGTWTRTMLEGWVQVVELPCILEHEFSRHFCCWDCLMRYAAGREPVTIVERIR